ncbi:MAG: hypothetical protein FWE43_02395 [Streptococcaceae bacterium]|nr:hypothetical protein [Streptococcaceae bacterium]
MENGKIIFENREKANLVLQNNLTTDYMGTKNFHDTLLDLIDDKEFIGICEAGNKYKAIMYLADKNIINVKILPRTDSQTVALAYPEVAVAAVELFVLLSVAAVVTPVLLWMARITDPIEGKTTFYEQELNYCMDIISKFGSKEFTNEMYEFFLAVENKETVKIEIGA